jgi:hypothetical protein
MRSLLALPLVIGITLAVADYDAARAIPANPRPLSAVAPASDIQLVRGRGGRAVAVRGPRGGAAVRGPRGGVAARGAYGGAAVRGPRGGVAARGAYGGQRCVDRAETLPCAAHVEELRCEWVPAITAAFGTALRVGTGVAGGGHMASAHAGVGLISATFGSAECSKD